MCLLLSNTAGTLETGQHAVAGIPLILCGRGGGGAHDPFRQTYTQSEWWYRGGGSLAGCNLNSPLSPTGSELSLTQQDAGAPPSPKPCTALMSRTGCCFHHCRLIFSLGN